MKKNIKLRGITWEHVRGYGPLDASVHLYEKKTGIDVSWEKRSLKDFGDAPVARLAKEYDLIILDHPHMGAAAASNCIVPIGSMLQKSVLANLADNSVGPSFQSYNYQGDLWALPIDAACQVSSYRKELGRNYRIPKSWSDVFILADQLGQRKQTIGMALCETDCNASFLTLCAQRGHVWTEDSERGISPVIGCEVLGMLQDLYRVCHPDSIYWNPINLYDCMTSEFNVLYSPLAFGYVNYSQTDYAIGTLTFAPIPGVSGSLLGGAGIAISSFCQNIPAAIQYAAWLCSASFQSTTYVAAGGQPAHKEAWLDQDVNIKTNNFFFNTLPTIEKAYRRPRSLNWPAFQEELGAIIHSFLLEGKRVDATWKRITTCYNFYFTKNP